MSDNDKQKFFPCCTFLSLASQGALKTRIFVDPTVRYAYGIARVARHSMAAVKALLFVSDGVCDGCLLLGSRVCQYALPECSTQCPFQSAVALRGDG